MNLSFFNSEISYKINLLDNSNWLYVVLYFKKIFEKIDFFILKSLVKNYYSDDCIFSSRELICQMVLILEEFLKIKSFNLGYYSFDETIYKFKKYKHQIIGYWKPEVSSSLFNLKLSNTIISILQIFLELEIIFNTNKQITFGNINIPLSIPFRISKISYIPIAGNINIKSFWCSKNVITNFQYLKFVKDQGYYNKKYWSDQGYYYIYYNVIRYPKNWKFHDNQWYINDISIEKLYNYPVMNISYHEAEACAKFYNARLPTNDEWLWIATNRNKTCNPYGINMPNIYELISDLHNNDIVDYLSSESLLKINQLYGNVWEFTYSDSSKYVNCKGGDNKIPSFMMNNMLTLKTSKENRYFSIGFRLVY